jgi:hypothetical protein
MPAERAAGNPNFYVTCYSRWRCSSSGAGTTNVELPDCHVIQGMIGILDVGCGDRPVQFRDGRDRRPGAGDTGAKRPGERPSERSVNSPGGCIDSAG